jgi:hypothetical protein
VAFSIHQWDLLRLADFLSASLNRCNSKIALFLDQIDRLCGILRKVIEDSLSYNMPSMSEVTWNAS